ncbi:MAG: FtsX-like permease family protein [Bacteroidetes bacterium]|nr:FtsX-like permease family protein [Bacteroidota bacterium]
MLRQRRVIFYIRKILGANGINISFLFLTEVLILLLVSTVIGIPVSIYFLNDWVGVFAHKITIGWQDIFLTFSIGLLITALVSVGFIFQAVHYSPVKFLRKE